MLEGLPEFIDVVDVFFGKLGRRTQDRLVEMLEEFCEERVRRHTDADFGAAYVEAARDVRGCRQNKRVGARNAWLHDVEGEIVYAGVVGRGTDGRDDERHEELLHGLLEGVQLVDGLGRFRIAADGVARLGRVQDEGVLFEGCGGKFYDACLRIFWMNFKTHA